jgi:hypothetical protein
MWHRIVPGTHYFYGLFFPGTYEPVLPFRYHDLEPGAFARNSVLGEGDTGEITISL